MAPVLPIVGRRRAARRARRSSSVPVALSSMPRAERASPSRRVIQPASAVLALDAGQDPAQVDVLVG